MAEAAESGPDGGSAPPHGTHSFPCDEYECKICYNLFDVDVHTPKVLGCSHTFCRECLDALHSREGRGWRLGCPLCRHRTPVPDYRVHNLPDDKTLIEALPFKMHNEGVSSAVQTAPCSASSPEPDDGCQTCKQVAFATGCVCAIFSFLSMVVLLFLGLIFVHNFNNSTPVGPVCLFVASVLALFSLILTWLMCMLKYRPEAEASSFSSLT